MAKEHAKERSTRLLNDELTKRGLEKIRYCSLVFRLADRPYLNAYIWLGNRVEVGLSMNSCNYQFARLQEVSCLFTKMTEETARILIDHYEMYCGEVGAITNQLIAMSNHLYKHHDVVYKVKCKEIGDKTVTKK
jgi:hypothetical protein